MPSWSPSTTRRGRSSARDVVEAAIAAARAHGAAIVAVPATDTVKQVAPDGLDRVDAAAPAHVAGADAAGLPHRPDPRARTRRRQRSAAPATDDAALVERLGARVHVVAGKPTNRKITTPDDLRWAEWLLTQPAAPR